MKYIAIVMVMLAGILVGLWGCSANRSQRIQMKIEKGSRITLCIDSIVGKQVFITHLETQDKIVLNPCDLVTIDRYMSEE